MGNVSSLLFPLANDDLTFNFNDFNAYFRNIQISGKHGHLLTLEGKSVQTLRAAVWVLPIFFSIFHYLNNI